MLEREAFLVFLEKYIDIELLQYNFNSLKIESTTPNIKTKFHNYIA